MSYRSPSMISGILVIIACIWLFLSPWIVGFGGNAGWNSTIVAVIIAVAAALRMYGTSSRADWAKWLDWLNVVLGAWLIIAPWVLNFEKSNARWNSVILGIIIAVLSLWSARTEQPATATA